MGSFPPPAACVNIRTHSCRSRPIVPVQDGSASFSYCSYSIPFGNDAHHPPTHTPTHAHADGGKVSTHSLSAFLGMFLGMVLSPSPWQSTVVPLQVQRAGHAVAASHSSSIRMHASTSLPTEYPPLPGMILETRALRLVLSQKKKSGSFTFCTNSPFPLLGGVASPLACVTRSCLTAFAQPSA